MGILSQFSTDSLAQTPASTTCDPNAQTLVKGNTGEIVVTLQNLLVENGYMDRHFVDGDFGPGTETAVKQFQIDNSLTTDGIVGPSTWQVLCSPPVSALSNETSGLMNCAGDIADTSCSLKPLQTFGSSVYKPITAPLDTADSIYIAGKTVFLGSKNLSSTPYLVTEEHYTDQGILKGVGNVTNNQTYISTHLSDELIQSTGNGTMTTQDGESIAWIDSSIGRPAENGSWVFYEIILFNNTQSKTLALLNNSIGLVKSTAGNEPDYMWLLN
ncbi:MAG: peptidoglycan-binding domain-containing protein [Candidatus Nitrosocosmicus sp.]|nr:peptidoglycan-binding protein [Candidatus Nitrosocosmicus sp.]